MKYTSTEDGSCKIKIPTNLAKAISWGKVAGSIIAVLTAIYFFVSPLYAIPSKLEEHEKLFNTQKECLTVVHDRLDGLDKSREVTISAVADIKSSLQDIRAVLQMMEKQKNETLVTLGKFETSLKYIEKGVAEVAGDVKELKGY